MTFLEDLTSSQKPKRCSMGLVQNDMLSSCPYVVFRFITLLIQVIRSFTIFSFVTFEVFTSLYLVNHSMCDCKFSFILVRLQSNGYRERLAPKHPSSIALLGGSQRRVNQVTPFLSLSERSSISKRYQITSTMINPRGLQRQSQMAKQAQ